MARSVVLNRRVLEVTLSFGRGSRRGWGERTGSHDAVRASRPHQAGLVSVTKVLLCARVCTSEYVWGMNTERASPRAHAHREGVVHLNRGGWYTHAAGVGWFLRRILASPVIARNEVKLTAYAKPPTLLDAPRIRGTLRAAFVCDSSMHLLAPETVASARSDSSLFAD